MPDNYLENSWGTDGERPGEREQGPLPKEEQLRIRWALRNSYNIFSRDQFPRLLEADGTNNIKLTTKRTRNG